MEECIASRFFMEERDDGRVAWWKDSLGDEGFGANRRFLIGCR